MNHTTIEQLAENCTVRIKIPGIRNGYGTGFFISPGYIVTCAHVLEQAFNQEIICSVRGNDEDNLYAKVVHSLAPEIDLAILQVNPKSSNTCVYIGDEVKSRDTCFSFGYTDPEHGNPDGDPITLECVGLAGKNRTIIKLKGEQVRPGMSGAPLLNLRTGKVCGIIVKTRNRQIDLGGEALFVKAIFQKFPVLEESHDSFHRTHNDWAHYFQEDIEPFPSDWKRLDRKDKCSAYLRALLFLISVLFKWLILGFKAPRAFPIETVSLLIRHTLAGDLGQEINKQRKELTKNLAKVDLESGGQAKIINQLESKATILSELIMILISESKNLASSSRLLWAVDLIYEQQDLLNELKEIEGNSYPGLENWKSRFGFLRTNSDRRYREVDKVINKLLLKYPDCRFGSLNYFFIVLEDLIGLLSKRVPMSVFVVDKTMSYLCALILKIEEENLNSEELDEEDDYAALVKLVLEELENDIQKYPHLKVLNKTKTLLENVAGKPIVGGPYRAWGKSKSKNKYHFSRKCKFYPERARPHEMAKISCYDSHEEAGKYHEPCKTCISAENIKSMDFIGDEPS